MGLHTATIRWQRDHATFSDNKYSRAHTWHFDGGAVVPASASPHIVRVPYSDPAGVDPEEAFVASLSSCHMLWFLGIAAERGFVVDAYEDAAEGTLARESDGVLRMTRVVLRPRVSWSAPVPDADTVHALHHAAHAACFIANSVRTTVDVEPVG
ncbi:MAG: OsmC family protein [Gemmatimonadetes bacterium]|nr:OsmC family protein [Gemmatimonadota bacterium]